jgi:hypothetical protein
MNATLILSLDGKRKRAMSTTNHSVTGKAMWAKVFPHNKETKDWQGNPHLFGGLFKIDVILDKENRAVYKASGTSGKLKLDEDAGTYAATFKRKEVDRFEWAGGPPQVVNEDGTPFTGVVIPNGSEVKVDFDVYTTSMSNGTRLTKVTVLKLEEMPDKPPTPVPSAPAPTKTSTGVEIPF